MAETEIFDASKGWGTEEFELKRPFKFAGVDFSKVVVRVPSGADIDAYVKTPDRNLRSLALKLADVDARVLDAMHGSDYARLLSSVGEFVAGVR